MKRGRRGLRVRKEEPIRYPPPSLARVLKIAREHVDAMIAHARADHPDEACGVIVGPEGSDDPVRLVQMINADRSPTFFRFDPAERHAISSESGARLLLLLAPWPGAGHYRGDAAR